MLRVYRNNFQEVDMAKRIIFLVFALALILPLVLVGCGEEAPAVGNGGISSDGKTYTFKLRNNVKWSDGEKVTADDFEYSIKRFFDPDLAWEYASMCCKIVGCEGGMSAYSARA